MNNKETVTIKIRRLQIKDYKGIDELELDLSAPRIPDEPDIFVMGSQNGLGKTSVIECCSLLLLALTIREERFRLQDRYSTVNIPDLLIRAGAKAAEISGDIVINEKAITIQVRIDRNGVVKIIRDEILIIMMDNELLDSETDADNFVKAICGFSSNPVIEKTFLLFHSYRKVQEGNPDLGMMVSDSNIRRRVNPYHRHEMPMSTFKLLILRSMMGQANLFEFYDDKEQNETIDKLNELTRIYAGGTISKLRPSHDNSLDFRIQPVNGGDTFTFDGLSSGQKEIISTLFLIFHHTQNNPCVVFIDEPELHLNSQWHRSFIKRLIKFAPHNQYIIATHSEDIMDSVTKDRRILLLNNQEDK